MICFVVIGMNWIICQFVEVVYESGKYKLIVVYFCSFEQVQYFVNDFFVEYLFISLEVMVESDVIDVVYIVSLNFLYFFQI